MTTAATTPEIAAAAKIQVIQEKRPQGGSRFNLHFGSALAPTDLVPERITAALGPVSELPLAGRGRGATRPAGRPKRRPRRPTRSSLCARA